MTPSKLNTKLDEYFALREALGFRLGGDKNTLRDFVGYWKSKGCPQPIRSQVAVEWACSGRGPARRLNLLRVFLSHLRATLPETEVPDRALVASYRRPQPYILSPQQVQAVMAAALRARPRGTLRPHTLYTLIGLLASTGLRPGEALRLTMPDVQLDLNPPQLQILDSKFHKSRLVPLHPTTADRLRSYVQKRKELGVDKTSGPFLVSNLGAALPHWVPMMWFRKLVRRLSLKAPASTSRLVLSSFRHTFAVSRMVTWYQEGADVLSLLPNLSVYMGHLHPQGSYWYLSATPELLGAAAERFQRYSGLGGES